MAPIQSIRKQSIHPSQTAQTIENFSLSKQVESLQKQIKDMKRRFYSSSAYKTYSEFKQIFRTQVYKPTSTAYIHTYNQLPQQTTKSKFNLLQKISYDNRILFLNAMALGSALITLNGINRFNSLNLGVKSLRNATLTYILGGLLIAPQIYNPVLKNWKQIAKQ